MLSRIVTAFAITIFIVAALTGLIHRVTDGQWLTRPSALASWR